MLDSPVDDDEGASEYWKEEMDGFDYMLDASPLIINKIREHTFHITGIKSYEYRKHHSHMAEQFEKKCKMLHEVDPWGLFVPEDEILGGFGHDTSYGKVNVDTLKFYETLIGMEKANCFSEIHGKNGIVVEIGAGWGGFAYQFKKIFPKVTYVIVDLPPTMIFSYTYLATCFPDAKFLVLDSKDNINSYNFSDYDFIFVTNFLFNEIALPYVSLGINMVSFQEMTEQQVMNYLTKLKNMGCNQFYSHNRDKSKHNNQINAVGICMKRIYKIEEISVLRYQYTDLKMKPPGNLISKKSIHDYRHLVGRL
jgi:putative sugar O-methyltransferase